MRIERLAQALSARGHDVELVTYHLAEERGQFDFPVHRIYGRLEIGSLPPGPTLAKLALWDPTLARLCARRLDERGFDVIHAHHFEGLLAAAWGRRGHSVPLVYDAHTMLAGELPAYGQSWLRRAAVSLGRCLDGWIPRLADHMIVVTDDIAQQLADRHGFDPRRITVVRNGVEVASFAPGGKPPAAARPELLVYTGTLAPYQGIDLLLQAFAQALAQRPRLRLRLLVSSSFDPFMPMAQRLGIAHALEVIRENFETVPALMAEAGIALLPRVDCPGLPQKLLNYMASGRAIVAFAGSAKLVEHEVNGLVVPNHDTDAFAQAIVRLADDPALAARLGRNAHRFVVETSTWEKAAERCERVYAGLLGIGRPVESRPAEPSSLLPLPLANAGASQAVERAPLTSVR
ncbi:glycosyltransferase family 4 protein [Benzoatithermus flavus]|uniref:Glycosyltransferase family 4 protein n=1 Tax=Benzoatithermus flavus TaxID=3108223 RepID=A0ABU8XX48_9PROT